MATENAATRGSQIFNKKASEKLQSPDDLDKYVQVTNPSVWVVLGACIALIVGLLIWGFFGAVSSSVTTTGVLVEGQIVCFVDAKTASQIDVGNTATVDGYLMEVASKGDIPFSREEARSFLKSDYLTSTLVTSDWSYVISLEGDSGVFYYAVPMSVVITTERVTPISLIFNG